jgi:Caspase domain
MVIVHISSVFLRKEGNHFESKNQTRPMKHLGFFFLPMLFLMPSGIWTTGVSSNLADEVEVFALIIGVEDYILEGADLHFSADDAVDIKAFLLSGKMGKATEENIVVLTNSDATKANILKNANSLFKKAGPEDIILFYFSGHGDRGFLLPHDVERGNPNSVVTFAEVKAAFRGSKSKKKILVADACHSGSVRLPEQTANADAIEDEGGKKSQVAVFMSSNKSQTSCETSKLKQGVFTYFFLNGLNGAADKDTNKKVTISELFYYVRDNVYVFSRDNCSDPQTPMLYGQFDKQLIVSNL